MQEFQKKKKLRRVLYSPITLVLLLLIFLGLIKGVLGVYVKEHTSAINLENEKKELAKLNERKENLEASFDYIKTDQGIENEIRTKFRAVKEGEKIAVIVDEKNPTSTEEATTTHGFWYKLFHWF